MSAFNVNSIVDARPELGAPTNIDPSNPDVQKARDVQEHFTQFVGETFFGQMIKAMRLTQGEAAYFNGGRAEEVFRGQLDQKLAEELTTASADQIANPMFKHTFPQLAELLEHVDQQQAGSLDQLSSLGRK